MGQFRQVSTGWPGVRCGKWDRKSVPVACARCWTSIAAPGNDIHAVFAQRQHLPLRIRAFVDFLRHTYNQPDY
jgi:hypothetical protein